MSRALLALGVCVMVGCSDDDDQGDVRADADTVADSAVPDGTASDSVDETDAAADSASDADSASETTAETIADSAVDSASEIAAETVSDPDVADGSALDVDDATPETCIDSECEALSYVTNTCESSGPCDGSPSGFVSTVTYACNDKHTACESVAFALDCGLTITDCSTCDFTGVGDGLCENDECKAAAATQCAAPACAGRSCGLDPVTGEDCGTCSEPGLLACNGGTCEAVCDDVACGSMSITINTCTPSGECDGSPDGSVLDFAFACSVDRTTCDPAVSAVSCGLSVTTCMPCDFQGTDDGLCSNDVCVAADTVVCE